MTTKTQNEHQRLIEEAKHLRATCEAVGLQLYGWNDRRHYTAIDNANQSHEINGVLADLIEELAQFRDANTAATSTPLPHPPASLT